MKKIFGIVFGTVILATIFSSGQAFAAKINVGPATFTIDEGTSQNVSVTLSQPIIGPGPDPAYVDIDIVSSDPSRVSVTPNPVHYAAGEWWQQKTFMVNTVADGVYGPDETITLTLTAGGNAPYYDGFVQTITITLKNIDPEPEPTPAPEPSPTPAAPVTPSVAPKKSKKTYIATTAIAAAPVVSKSPAPATNEPTTEEVDKLQPSPNKQATTKQTSTERTNWWVLLVLVAVPAIYYAKAKTAQPKKQLVKKKPAKYSKRSR